MTKSSLHDMPALPVKMLTFALLIAASAASACDDSHCSTHRAHIMVHAGPAQTVVAATNSPTVAATTLKNTVVIRNFAFQPATVTVAAGSKVTWTNRDEEPHLVVSAGAQFPASPALDTDDSYSATFTEPGTYTYFCSIHPHMVGTIVVK